MFRIRKGISSFDYCKEWNVIGRTRQSLHSIQLNSRSNGFGDAFVNSVCGNYSNKYLSVDVRGKKAFDPKMSGRKKHHSLVTFV